MRGPETAKGAAGGAPFTWDSNNEVDQAVIVFTRDDNRDNFRATVFLCSTPLVTPRASSGCAAFSAAAA